MVRVVLQIRYSYAECQLLCRRLSLFPSICSVYTNHWESPTHMVSVEDRKLRGGGMQLKAAIWDAAKSTIEQWTGMEQKPTSMYGIRVYTDGAILSPHVDRIPLISSCIVNVAQDVDEPWPLEVYDREGNAVNVTMEPGDMVLYESGSLLHGRPFPLKGKYFANIFIHFEPTGRPLFDHTNDYLDEMDDFLPPYVIPDSPQAENWARSNPHGWRKPSPSAPIQQINSPEGHQAAAAGDVERLAKIAAKDRKALRFKDENGWQPIHEAARAGHVDAVELLIKSGAQLNSRTGPTGKGGSPLNIALDYHDATHPLPRYLLSIGAENIEPEL
jgi:prolyl 4-hydroxylase